MYVSSGSTDSYTLTGLSTGETYNITVAGTSDHFFSGNIEWETVTLLDIGEPHVSVCNITCMHCFEIGLEVDVTEKERTSPGVLPVAQY